MSFLMVTCGKELAGCFLPPKLGDPRESTRMIWGAMREDFGLFIIRSLLGGLVGEMAQWVGRGKFCPMDVDDETRDQKQGTTVVACTTPCTLKKKERGKKE